MSLKNWGRLCAVLFGLTMVQLVIAELIEMRILYALALFLIYAVDCQLSYWSGADAAKAR